MPLVTTWMELEMIILSEDMRISKVKNSGQRENGARKNV